MIMGHWLGHGMEKWTFEKVNKAIAEAKENDIMYFDYYCNTKKELEMLNKNLFNKRPDLILHISKANNDHSDLMKNLKNIKKLYLADKNMEYFRNISQLLYFEVNTIGSSYTWDLICIEGLTDLLELRISGKTKNLDIIGNFTNLEKLYLSTTVKDYNFIKPLNKIENIMIDSCTSDNNFTLLNKPSLKELSICSIKNLEDIDTIRNFRSISKFHLAASRIKLLPKMDNLKELKELRLDLLKLWENPEVLKAIPKLERLELNDINTKLEAEQFYFLTEMQTVKEIDFRFIDFNKKRIDLLNKWFVKNGKESILKR
jgi:hypothetical protein